MRVFLNLVNVNTVTETYQEEAEAVASCPQNRLLDRNTAR